MNQCLLIILLVCSISFNAFAKKTAKVIYYVNKNDKYSGATGGGLGGGIGIGFPLWNMTANGTGNGAAVATQKLTRMINNSNMNPDTKKQHLKLAQKAIKELAALEKKKFNNSVYQRKVQQIIQKYKSIPSVKANVTIEKVVARKTLAAPRR
jgi:hypothetical protein